MTASRSGRGPVRVTVGEYLLLCTNGELPLLCDNYREHAALAEDFDQTNDFSVDVCFFAVARGGDWPFLVVTQRYSPSGSGFDPGALLVPETGVLFIGAGEHLLAYDLLTPRQLWEDVADVGFWSWRRQGDIILMSAELELAAWDIHGRKLWTTVVEPPWDYDVRDGIVRLDVMGQKSSFDLRSGPQAAP